MREGLCLCGKAAPQEKAFPLRGRWPEGPDEVERELQRRRYGGARKFDVPRPKPLQWRVKPCRGEKSSPRRKEGQHGTNY